MATVSTVSSSAAQLASKTQSDSQVLTTLGKNLDTAEKNLDKVLAQADPKPQDIEKAKLDLEKAMNRFKVKTAMMDAVNRMIDQIIQRFGRIGG